MLKTCAKLFDLTNFLVYKNIETSSGNHSLEVLKLEDGPVFRFNYHNHTIVSIKFNNDKEILDDPKTFISDCGYDTASTKRAIGAYIELIHENFPDSLQFFEVDSEYAKRKITEFEDIEGI